MSIRDRTFQLRNGMLEYTKRHTKETLLQYAIDAYGFLLKPQREYTGKQFASEVKRTYSLDHPRNKAIYDILMEHKSDVFIRRRW